jgi:ADP-heptose:LPS heptosyltransferase
VASENILVIKHGALGDIILATGPMKAIRDHHKETKLILLTTKAYAPLLEQSGWFDDIWIDPRPKVLQISKWWRLIKQLNSKPFSRVYDLQTSSRSSLYLTFFQNNLEWSGIAKAASHQHDTPHRTSSHTIDRQKEQLAIAGIDDVPAPDISWLSDDIDTIKPDIPYILVIPGGSAHRPEKRWPVEHYIDFIQSLSYQAILIGTGAEAELLEQISNACSNAMNLCNQTNVGHIAELARHAKYAVGNDTGPMHIIAATGCRSVVLFSDASNPDLCAPRGEHVTILQQADLADLAVESVRTITT